MKQAPKNPGSNGNIAAGIGEERRSPMFEGYPDVLGIDDVCAILRIGRTSAYAMVRHRNVPFFRIGRQIRFSKEAVIEAIREDRIGEREGVEQSVRKRSSNRNS